MCIRCGPSLPLILYQKRARPATLLRPFDTLDERARERCSISAQRKPSRERLHLSLSFSLPCLPNKCLPGVSYSSAIHCKVSGIIEHRSGLHNTWLHDKGGQGNGFPWDINASRRCVASLWTLSQNNLSLCMMYNYVTTDSEPLPSLGAHRVSTSSESRVSAPKVH